MVWSEGLVLDALAYFSRSGQHWMRALLMTYRLPGLVAQGQLDALADGIAQAHQLAERTGVRDGDAAALAQQAADACQAAGQTTLVAMLTELVDLHR